MLFRSIKGREGIIRIDSLGAVIGQMARWELTAEKKGDDNTGLYIFRGTLEYINQALFRDEDYSPSVILTLQRDPKTKKLKQFRLDQQPGRKRALEGRSLLMEGVTLCQL